jgi:hypothetical protein
MPISHRSYASAPRVPDFISLLPWELGGGLLESAIMGNGTGDT